MKTVHLRFYGQNPTPGRLPGYVSGIFDGNDAFEVLDSDDKRWLGCPLLMESSLSREIPLGVPVQMAHLRPEEKGFSPEEVIWWQADQPSPHVRVVTADTPFPPWRGVPLSFLELFTWDEKQQPVEALRRVWREAAASRQGPIPPPEP